MRITELPATSEAALTDYIAIDDSSLGTRKLLLSDIRASSVYWSVADLGLTVGSAALADVWSAMEDGSQAIFVSSELALADRPPYAPDMLVCITRLSDTQGQIDAYALSSSTSDKRMYLDDDTPDGFWRTRGRLVFNMSNIQLLPYSTSDSRVSSDMRVVQYTLSNPFALGGDLTVETSNGNFSISGSLIGTTDIQLILEATN